MGTVEASEEGRLPALPPPCTRSSWSSGWPSPRSYSLSVWAGPHGPVHRDGAQVSLHIQEYYFVHGIHLGSEWGGMSVRECLCGLVSLGESLRSCESLTKQSTCTTGLSSDFAPLMFDQWCRFNVVHVVVFLIIQIIILIIINIFIFSFDMFEETYLQGGRDFR